jgi:3-phenylpropionate/trans-cinnamate dioxygenase ferredoxin subunit
MADGDFEAVIPIVELAPGRLTPCVVKKTELLLCKMSNGVVHAVRDRCSHMNKPLHGGRLIGNQISCPEHGATFDITTGAALCFPAVRPIKSYPVEIRDGIVYVSVGSDSDAPMVNPMMAPWGGR